MSAPQNDPSRAQTWKSSGPLGTPGLSSAPPNNHFVSHQHAGPTVFLEDEDLEDFSNYSAPAFDDLFDDRFGPMLSLDDNEDSFDARNELHQTSSVDQPSNTFNHQSVTHPMQSIDSTTAADDVFAESDEVGPSLDRPEERQGGVDPTQRAALNETSVPTLHEQEEQRNLEDKKANVERWLTDKKPRPTDDSTDVPDDAIVTEHDASLSSSYDDPIPVNEDSNIASIEHEDALQDLPKGSFKGRFWQDSPIDPDAPPLKSQPSSSNAAIYRFEQRARDIETASRTATIGSRRRSLDSLFSAAGVSVRVPHHEDDQHAKSNRRTSLLNRVLPKRSNSNLKKRKGIETPHPASQEKSRKDSTSASRSRSPALDTGFAPAKSTLSPKSPASLAPPTNTWAAQARNVIRRTRSRTEADRPSLLASMWTQQGGPPVPTLRSPSNDAIASSNNAAHYDSDEDGNNIDPNASELQHVPNSATYEGFKTHAQELNPSLPLFMVERITQEQMRRYKKLVDFRIKHLAAVSDGYCNSGQRCIDLGGGPISPPVQNSGKTSDAPSVGFHITANISPEEGSDQIGDGTTIAAHFPPGVPIPPVQLLPAEFECPLCFQVKLISKPSDWTKHVHEDVQPFTCTFPDCGEPKSFKRKADWVRHENERHRQLEKWVCNFPECVHTCYRKDNFVQHLVREHKLPEPRTRASRAAGSGGTLPGVSTSSVTYLLQTCRHETTKQPQDEGCRFCGATCISWKKLTVHLAKHMEELSMPVLTLVEGTMISKDTVLSPLEERANSLRPVMPSPSGGSMRSAQSRSISPGKLSRSPHGSENDRLNPLFSSHSGATYPPPNPTLASNSNAYGIPLDSSTIPNELLEFPYTGYANVHPSSNLQVDPHQNLLSPMDGSSYHGSYGSYGSSGSSNNAFYELADAPLQQYGGSNITSNPSILTSNSGALPQQPVYASPVDNTAFPFNYDTSHAFVQAPTSNSPAFAQYATHSTEMSGQPMDFQGSHNFVQQALYTGEQDRLSRFQGNTYPPQNIHAQRPTSQPPPQGTHSHQGHLYGSKDQFC